VPRLAAKPDGTRQPLRRSRNRSAPRPALHGSAPPGYEWRCPRPPTIALRRGACRGDHPLVTSQTEVIVRREVHRPGGGTAICRFSPRRAHSASASPIQLKGSIIFHSSSLATLQNGGGEMSAEAKGEFQGGADSSSRDPPRGLPSRSQAGSGSVRFKVGSTNSWWIAKQVQCKFGRASRAEGDGRSGSCSQSRRRGWHANPVPDGSRGIRAGRYPRVAVPCTLTWSISGAPRPHSGAPGR